MFIETTQVGKSCELLVLLYAARLANLQDMLYMLQDSPTISKDLQHCIYAARLANYFLAVRESCSIYTRLQILRNSSRVLQHI